MVLFTVYVELIGFASEFLDMAIGFGTMLFTRVLLLNYLPAEQLNLAIDSQIVLGATLLGGLDCSIQ